MSSDENVFLLIILLISLFGLMPIIWVLTSDRSHGGAKFGWFLVTFFFSWLGLAVFLIVTQTPANWPRKKPGVIRTGIQVSVGLFLITFIFWCINQSGVLPPSVWDTLVTRILIVLTWPMETLQLPLWMGPVINLLQGFVLVFLPRVCTKKRAAKIGAGAPSVAP
jgi:hypothetical protein